MPALRPTGIIMPNRLANETSPYLLQHQNNPVDWFPWGDEAFAKAAAEDKPVFLSVGYSSCHWCHVMEHESFEDEGVAELLNRHFVSVKVDREERPDVDEAYMTAVQLTSGRGGWPMSVFLTPDRKPFFAGTYFPREDRGQHAGFVSILSQIANLWSTRRKDLVDTAQNYATALTETLTGRSPGTFDKLEAKVLDDAVRTLAADFDAERGGFGGAPKFPPHSAVEFLLAYAVQADAPAELREAALGMAAHTLEQMALGGIHDHVGGGFHRYSTDAEWLLPHFEKMLYDNALLVGNYSRAAGLLQDIEPRLSTLFLRVVEGIVHWTAREMTSPEGLFMSALDADSEGEEGKFYVWSIEEARQLAGDALVSTYGFSPEGNFQDEATGERTGANIPHLRADTGGSFAAALDALRERRDTRVRPGLDDKVLVGWNGLMIGGLAEAGVIELAALAARGILQAERQLGRLPHQIAKGRASGDAYLDDYAYFTDGLLKLAEVCGFLEEEMESPIEPAAFWRSEAVRLAEEMVAQFYDNERGGFFATSDRHEFLFGRTKPVFDQPTPSGNAVAIRVLSALGRHDEARLSLEALLGWMQRAPQATEALHLAAIPYAERAQEPSRPPQAATNVEVLCVMEPKEARVGADGKGTFRIRLEVPSGMHVNSPEPPARWLTPTLVKVQPLRADVRYPGAFEDRYEGTVEIPFTVELPASESGAEFEVTVTFQACTESECQLPQEKTFAGVVYR